MLLFFNKLNIFYYMTNYYVRLICILDVGITYVIRSHTTKQLLSDTYIHICVSCLFYFSKLLDCTSKPFVLTCY